MPLPAATSARAVSSRLCAIGPPRLCFAWDYPRSRPRKHSVWKCVGTRWGGHRARMWRVVAAAAAIALLVGGAAQGGRKAAPANTSLPAISGTAREGETLTASSGSWSGTNPITFTYRWQRCNSGGGSCSNIGGATSQTYKLEHGDVGH